MKDLHTTPDEHLEARITAWVLGQASPFEEAELEALCAADPELQLFLNRTKALHALLLETPPSASDQFWKLSPENREKLDPIIGSNNSTAPHKNTSIRRAAYRAAFGIAAVFTVTMFIKRFIIMTPPMMKEAHTTVSYEFESAPEEASFSRRDNGDKLYNDGERSPDNGVVIIGGHVKKPGAQEFKEGLTLADAVASAGGATEFGSTKRVTLYREGKVETYDLTDKRLAQLELKPNDTIDMPQKHWMGCGTSRDELLNAPSKNAVAPTQDETTLAMVDSDFKNDLSERARRESNKPAGMAPSSQMKAQESRAMNAEPPQSSTPKFIAAAEAEEIASTPAPSITAPKPAAKLSKGKANDGGGRGPAEGEGIDAFASNDNQNKGGFIYESGAAKKGALRSSGSQSRFYTEEEDKSKNETSSTTVPGVPSATGTPNQTTPGLRSGDYAVAGESIDAILNNPNRNADENINVLPASEVETPLGGQSLGDGSLAQREIARRQNNITEADRKLVEGREAYAKGDYAQATDKYKEALGAVRDIPAQADRLESYSQHLADASVAQAQQMQKFGKYDEASVLLKQAESLSPQDARIKNELDYLEDPLRTNPATTFEHAEKVDQVRRDLYKAQGSYDLGKYDDAKKSYEDILRIDPYNEAARRGMEKVAGAKSDYYRAAYGQTRSELLMEVDKAWELAVPAEGEKNEDPFTDNKVADNSYFRAAYSNTRSSHLEADIADNPKNNLAPADAVGYLKLKEGESNFDLALRAGSDRRDLSIIREFQYPTEYEVPEILGGAGDKSVASDPFAALAQTGKDEVALLEDIPTLGRLFNEGKKQRLESELQTGTASEYFFRGAVVADQKKPSLIDLSEEISAEKETFSTFSLNISDASFQLASAAVAKGERPDPTSIKPEQFYNAVDYGDPAPSASEPVAAAIDQTAHPVIPGRNLVRVALRTGSTGRSAAQPLRLTLLVDQSGSMVRADRRVAMETALAQLATLLTENDQVTVIGFSRTPHLLAQSLPGNQAAKLPELINQTASEGGTNLEQAINLATEQAISHHLAGAQNRIVLFTDGAANLGDADPDRLSEKIKNIRQQGLAFDIAGIGTNDVNDKLLSDLARHGNGRYYLVGEKTAGNLAAQLAGAFRPAAENVKVQVKLNPQRVGNYKLIGFEKDRLKTEDFRNDAVDAAELAADEAGVALYQVETLTEGTGEIGEVSVRFRDTASGEMVERTWTIPYDASAPSFDKANPKTQLATLALLAAQKLQTGPMADAIDFSNYSETIAKLKQANANSSKIQQLLNLIKALK